MVGVYVGVSKFSVRDLAPKTVFIGHIWEGLGGVGNRGIIVVYFLITYFMNNNNIAFHRNKEIQKNLAKPSRLKYLLRKKSFWFI